MTASTLLTLDKHLFRLHKCHFGSIFRALISIPTEWKISERYIQLSLALASELHDFYVNRFQFSLQLNLSLSHGSRHRFEVSQLLYFRFNHLLLLDQLIQLSIGVHLLLLPLVVLAVLVDRGIYRWSVVLASLVCPFTLAIKLTSSPGFPPLRLLVLHSLWLLIGMRR